MDFFRNQGRELQEKMDGIQNICEHEAFIESMNKETSKIMKEGQPEKALKVAPSLEGGKWQLFTSGNRQHSSSGPAAIQLKTGKKLSLWMRRSPVQWQRKTSHAPLSERGSIPLLPSKSNGWWWLATFSYRAQRDPPAGLTCRGIHLLA